jgi:hypothetical protein
MNIFTIVVAEATKNHFVDSKLLDGKPYKSIDSINGLKVTASVTNKTFQGLSVGLFTNLIQKLLFDMDKAKHNRYQAAIDKSIELLSLQETELRRQAQHEKQISLDTNIQKQLLAHQQTIKTLNEIKKDYKQEYYTGSKMPLTTPKIQAQMFEN